MLLLNTQFPLIPCLSNVPIHSMYVKVILTKLHASIIHRQLIPSLRMCCRYTNKTKSIKTSQFSISFDHYVWHVDCRYYLLIVVYTHNTYIHPSNKFSNIYQNVSRKTQVHQHQSAHFGYLSGSIYICRSILYTMMYTKSHTYHHHPVI